MKAVKISIPQLIEYEKAGPEVLLTNLKKGLKPVHSAKYDSPSISHAELLNRENGIAKVISEIKAVQWKIVNYSIVLNAALVSTSKLIQFDKARKVIVVPCMIYFVLIAVVVLIAVQMLRKTDFDLSYYRKHLEINDDLLAHTTGIAKAANIIVSKLESKYIGTDNYEISAKRNFMTFSLCFYMITALGGIFAIASIQLLLLL